MNSSFPRHAAWPDILSAAADTLVACAVICGAVRAFCWCFFIPFAFRYSIGAVITVMMLNWLILKPQKQENNHG